MELLARALEELEKLYGRPPKPLPKTPLAWILWENVGYLVDDERRARAFQSLARSVGLKAGEIAKASEKTLRAVAELGGMHPARRAEKLRGIARTALEAGSQELREVLRLPLPEARRRLQRFPGIGAPGADKILMLCGAAPVLALESNGLRVVVRLGYGTEGKSYASTYRSALEALAPELRTDSGWLARVHLLLRAHGKGLCKTNAPDCDACPLADRCRYARGAVPSRRPRGYPDERRRAR